MSEFRAECVGRQSGVYRMVVRDVTENGAEYVERQVAICSALEIVSCQR